MRDASWNECLETGSSLKVTTDRFKINSLIETANGRIGYLNSGKINEGNANYVFEGYYASILELLHAVILRSGYRVSNHICAGYYLRDALKRDDLFRAFDDLRFKRNSLTYYGRRMDFQTAMESIRKSTGLVRKLKELLE